MKISAQLIQYSLGTGGYISTHQPKGLGFVNYIKKRLLGADSKFRDDTTYVMFMFLLKETVELKRSRVTFFRKARTHYKEKTDFLKEAKRDEIERTDVGFKGILFNHIKLLLNVIYVSAFKLMRGTAPYFQNKKLSVMAMIRQLGPPHLFVTLSSAEVTFI